MDMAGELNLLTRASKETRSETPCRCSPCYGWWCEERADKEAGQVSIVVFWDAPQQQVKYSLCEEVRTDEITGVRTDKLVYRGRFLPKKNVRK